MAEREIETSIEINASPERVWSVLTDFPRMGAWNPFIRSISGSPVRGGRLSVQIAPPGKRGMRFNPTVIVADAPRELRWLGHLLSHGLFDGEHYFLLERTADGKTLLIHGEKFSGILVGLFGRGLDATKAGFDAMNRALKRRAEEAGHEAAP
jgi:hypothetical protein